MVQKSDVWLVKSLHMRQSFILQLTYSISVKISVIYCVMLMFLKLLVIFNKICAIPEKILLNINFFEIKSVSFSSSQYIINLQDGPEIFIMNQKVTRAVCGI